MMHTYLISVFILLGMTFFSTHAQAGNPGVSATNCVSVTKTSDDFDNLVFKNQCGRKVFVVWCGELRNSEKNCGDGPRDSYYTHSFNFDQSGTRKQTLKQGGSYRYAACVGSIGFGSEGIEHPAGSNGHYRCTSTGN